MIVNEEDNSTTLLGVLFILITTWLPFLPVENDIISLSVTIITLLSHSQMRPNIEEETQGGGLFVNWG